MELWKIRREHRSDGLNIREVSTSSKSGGTRVYTRKHRGAATRAPRLVGYADRITARERVVHTNTGRDGGVGGGVRGEPNKCIAKRPHRVSTYVFLAATGDKDEKRLEHYIFSCTDAKLHVQRG